MNPADTAFIILCATFVMLMTPALALFYGGLVRSKNILSTCMHSYASLGMVSIIWALFGYSLAFSGDISGLIGNLDHVFLMGVGGEANGPAANLPHNVFMAFQCMFAALTVALISGAYAERIRFSAMLVFSALWTVFAYCPMAHWVWGGGWMAKLGAVDFAGGAVVHMASAAAALACASASAFAREYAFAAVVTSSDVSTVPTEAFRLEESTATGCSSAAAFAAVTALTVMTAAISLAASFRKEIDICVTLLISGENVPDRRGPVTAKCRSVFGFVTVLSVFCFRTVTYYTSRFPICQIL